MSKSSALIGQADVHFVNEGLTGLAATGSYLNDVARRFGIKIDKRCNAEHCCEARITQGQSLLSGKTEIENEYFGGGGNRAEYRLMCQTRIEKEGEVAIMTSEKKSAAAGKSKTKDLNEEFKKAFEKMPLEKKIANLVDLEAMTLGDTFSYVLNSPFKVFEKMADTMADFGFRKENAQKTASRPDSKPSSGAAAKRKPAAKKRSRSRKPKAPMNAQK